MTTRSNFGERCLSCEGSTVSTGKDKARLFHYTASNGYHAIASTPVWLFKASKPAADHPRGAYFTTLRPNTRKLAQRLRIPKEKTAYAFCFAGADGIMALEGGRGAYVFFSPTDYEVGPDRQAACGLSHEVLRQLS